MLNPSPRSQNRKQIKIKIKIKISPLFVTLTLFPLQDFSFRETDFYFYLFISSFFKYSSLNLPSSYLYNIFTVYFPKNSPLLKSLFSALSNLSCYLTSKFILPSNLTTTFFAFSKSFSLSQLLCSIINPFHCTKYFTTSLIFLLFSTSHSSTLSTSTGFISSIFCFSICFLYYTT